MPLEDAEIWAGRFIDLVENKTVYTRSTEQLIRKIQVDALREASSLIASRLTLGSPGDERHLRIYRETIEQRATELEKQRLT